MKQQPSYSGPDSVVRNSAPAQAGWILCSFMSGISAWKTQTAEGDWNGWGWNPVQGPCRYLGWDDREAGLSWDY